MSRCSDALRGREPTNKRGADDEGCVDQKEHRVLETGVLPFVLDRLVAEPQYVVDSVPADVGPVHA